ncbi:TetR/AcrR family transcriptional regulator [Amycolatopsis sp. NBC_00348]|uniref:TetR/AcrR family transcriptional regulator n=1 Tax=unclassified Amycolatopsis TaxID=2618356 RepID=UPI002E0EC8E2|nr:MULTISPECIES: TetR/AcrR family transcriptional regulator [unclassified Amycolatopsis]WSJ81028.1 TetR/AcrR family transcriptional regulator [Amycolatopsis sp. NBC_01307]
MARPPSITEADLIDLLVKVFREKGVEGTAIGDLSAATGLQRASLYHRFPDGKEGMADAVLTEVGKRFLWILAPMREDPDVTEGITETAQRLGQFYGAGALSCVLDTMTLAGTPERLRDHARALAKTWIDAMAEAAQRAGRRPDDAMRAARDVFLRIEGSLVLARVLGDNDAFAETVALMPSLLAPPKTPTKTTPRDKPKRRNA